MELALLPDPAANGGFPEPSAAEPVRVVAARHQACGGETRVRVPGILPAGVVRRVRCSRCHAFFSTDRVEDLGLESDGPRHAAPAAGPDAGGHRFRFEPIEVESSARPVAPDSPSAPRLEAVLLPQQAPAPEPAAAPVPALAPMPVPVPTPAPTPEPAAAPAPTAPPAPVARASVLDRVRDLALRLPDLRLPDVRLPSLRLADVRVPDLRLPDLRLPPFDPDGRAWRLASIPLAAIAVVVGLLLIQGGGGEPQTADERSVAAGAASPGEAQGSSGGGDAKVSGDAKLVRGSSYSLALPGGWDQVQPQGGATFAAVAADGGADATLWIERDPSLDFPTFVARSIEQLRGLAGSARVVERVPAPTIEATVVRLAADAPAGQPTYEVTLRAVGPYRYYLATSVQPDASAEAVEGAALVAGSFTPDLGGRG